MRPLLVVVAPPFFDALPGVSQRQEPRGVQALGPEPGVKGLDEGVVRRLPGPAEVQHHAFAIGPAPAR
jgi:hypothetical protein